MERLKKSPFRASFLIPILIVFSVGIYVNVISGEFLLDDNLQILRNQWIKSPRHLVDIFFSPAWSFLSDEFAHEGDLNFYRPVFHLLYMLVYSISELDPRGFHILNICLHAFTVVMVYLLSTSLLKKFKLFGDPDQSADSSLNVLISFYAALVFAVNPINTETVSWLSSSVEIAAALFFLMSFYFYINRKYIISAIMLLAASLSMETGLTLLFLFVCYDIVVLREPLKPIASWVKRYRSIFVAIFIYFGLRMYVLGSFAPIEPENQLSLYQYFINMPALGFIFIFKLVFPVNLIFYTYMPVVPFSSILDPRSILLIIATFFIIFILIKKRVTQPFYLFMVLWIFVPLLPIFYFGWTKGYPVYADRFLYISASAFALFLAVVLFRLIYFFDRRKKGKGLAWMKTVVAIFMVAIVALYSLGTIKRNHVWLSELNLWQDTAHKDPGFELGRFHYALELVGDGRIDEALVEYQAVVVINPSNIAARNNIGIIYAQRGLFEQAAIEFRKALDIDPDNLNIRDNLTKALVRMGR